MLLLGIIQAISLSAGPDIFHPEHHCFLNPMCFLSVHGVTIELHVCC